LLIDKKRRRSCRENITYRKNIYQTSVEEPELRAEIKLPPGAGAVIHNFGSGFSSGSACGSFPILKDFYRKKSWLLNNFL
jgi:hypothetical protein